MNNPLVERFGTEKRWVNWTYKTVNGKKTKIPMSLSGTPASSTDVFTWSTYEEAINANQQVGIVFTPEQDLLGIDIDHCLEGNTIVHEDKELIADLLSEADSYTEVSPSGTGLHILVALSEPLALTSNKKAPFEVYTSGRYFTFTGTPYKEAKEVRTVTKEEALTLLSTIGYPWKKTPASKAHATSTSSLSDGEVLEKMFASKTGKKIRSLYEGDISGYKDDESSADMALLSHLAFWTGKDASQMERLWVSSPLGAREKTSGRKDYRDRTIEAAISGCKEVYTSPEAKIVEASEGEDLDLLSVAGPKGRVVFLQNTENMTRILDRHPRFKGRLRYDMFKNTYEIHDGKWRTVEDVDAITLQTEVSVLFPDFFGSVTKGMIIDAMFKVAKKNAIDSAKDYITGITWDGIARLDDWLRHTYGVPDDEYHRKVGSNWMKGLVKRIVQPGCKFDYVLVLEGEQGSKKSTSLGVLGGDWHVETTMSTESKDFFMQFQGKAIIEFSEGETLSRTEVKKMKAIITTQVDKYRMPYERTSQDFPRRCVFAMTTNQEEYLKDETGNRRWLPVRVELPEADVVWLRNNRDQLFAEAYHRITTLKETVYEFPKEETEAHQQLRRVSDPHEASIVGWFFDKVSDDDKNLNGITIDRAYVEALHRGMSSRPINKSEEMSIAGIFKDVLKLEKRRMMQDGVRNVKWFAKGDTPKLEIESNYQEMVRNF